MKKNCRPADLSEEQDGSFLCDKPGNRLPCLHEQAFAGQRTANGFAVSCPWYRGDRGRKSSPIRSDELNETRAGNDSYG